MRCRRGGTPRGSRTVVFTYGYIVIYEYIFADVPRDNRITTPPGRMHEATRHHTEKDCGERRKDRRMHHERRRHNAMRHGPSCLGSPRPVVPRLPTARRASAPHGPSCLGSSPLVVPRLPIARHVQRSGIPKTRHPPHAPAQHGL